MRTSIVTMFDETLERCLDSTLEATLGRGARDEVYGILAKKGISKSLVSSMIDAVAEVLRDVFGEGHRLIIHRAVVELYREYSQRVDFSFGDSVKNRLEFLKERVVTDHLHPRRSQEDPLDSFFDQKKRPVRNGDG